MTKRQIRSDTVWCLRSHGLLTLLLLHRNYFAEHIVLFMSSLDCKTCRIGCVNNFAQFPCMKLFYSQFSWNSLSLSSCLCESCKILSLLLKVNLSSFFLLLHQLLKSVFQQMSLEESLTWPSVAFCIKTMKCFPYWESFDLSWDLRFAWSSTPTVNFMVLGFFCFIIQETPFIPDLQKMQVQQNMCYRII